MTKDCVESGEGFQRQKPTQIINSLSELKRPLQFIIAQV